MTLELHGAESTAYVEEKVAEFLSEHSAASEPILLHLHSNPCIERLSAALFAQASCARVRELHLDGCGLRSLPDGFCANLPALEDLALHDNRLAALPADIGLLKSLFSLRLDRNLLRELPRSIGDCAALTVLHVDGNPLQSLPDELGNATFIADLGLGSLPELRRLPPSLARLESLVVLWIEPATASAIENVPAAAFEEGPEALRACLRAQLETAGTDAAGRGEAAAGGGAAGGGAVSAALGPVADGAAASAAEAAAAAPTAP